jgi:molybdopterin-guanine dinucleotide biosynthesis protein A
MQCKNISGVVLAGGANKRFNGSTKAKIVIDGKTIISRIIDTLTDIFDEIIIVTNTPEEYEEFKKHKIITDVFDKKGPLGGIHAALKASSKDAIFVFAGDMPFLNKGLIIKQIEYYRNHKYDILIPMINENIEPLHGIYDLSVNITLEEYLKADHNKAVREFFKLVKVGYIQFEDSEETRKAFTNINSPSDIVFY